MSLLCLVLSAHAGIWDKPPLSGDPDAILLAAGEAFRTGGGTLWRSVDIRIEPGGLTTHETHEVMLVANADSLPSLDVSYAPWHEDKPIVTARVIYPDGTTADLDPAKQTDSLIGVRPGRVFTDAHLLRTPLDAVLPGAVVEWHVIERQHAPFLGEGASGRQFLHGTLGELHEGRLVLRSPRSAPLDWQVHGVREQALYKSRGRYQQLTLEYGELAPFPHDIDARWVEDPTSFVEYTTYGHWSAVRDAYAPLVDPLYDSEAVADLLGDELPTDRLERIAAHMGAVNDAILYTGVEAGRHSIVPYSPATVRLRGYGDCKDQAVVLASLLRLDGIHASIALIRSDTRALYPRPLPNPRHFNHAIVYVPGDPPLWLDPTATTTPVGQLPPRDQQRTALPITGAVSDALITPATRSTLRTTLRQDRVSPGYPVEIETHIDGWQSSTLRTELLEGTDGASQLREHLQERWQADDVTVIDLDGLHHRSAPLHLKAQVMGSGYRQDGRDSVTAMYPSPLRRLGLDDTLQKTAGADGQRAIRVERQSLEHVLVVDAPPGFGPMAQAVPAVGQWQFGPARMSRTLDHQGDQWVFTTTLEVDDVVMRLQDLRALEQHTGGLGRGVDFALGVDPSTDVDDPVARLRSAHAILREHPDDPDVLAGWLRTLTDLGFTREARRVARGSTALAASSDALAFSISRTLWHGDDSRSTGRTPRIDALRPLLDSDEPMIAEQARWDLVWLLQQRYPSFAATERQSREVVDEIDRMGVPPSDANRRRGRRHLLKLGETGRIRTQDGGWPSGSSDDAVRMAAQVLGNGMTHVPLSLSLREEGRFDVSYRAAMIVAGLGRYDLARALVDAGLKAESSPSAEHRDKTATIHALVPWRTLEDAGGVWSGVLRDLTAFQQEWFEDVMPLEDTRDQLRWNAHVNALQSYGLDRSAAEFALDWVMSTTERTIETREDVHRLTTTRDGKPWRVYARGKGSAAVVVATKKHPALLGVIALELFSRGRTSAAKDILSWVVDDLPAEDRNSPYRFFLDALLEGDGSVTDVRAAAAILAASSDTPADLRRVEQLARRASEPVRVQAAECLMLRWMWKGDLPQATRIYDTWPHDEVTNMYAHSALLRAAGRLDPLEALLDRTEAPSSERAWLQVERGEYDEALAEESLGDTSRIYILLRAGRISDAVTLADELMQHDDLKPFHYVAAAEAWAAAGRWTDVARARRAARKEGELSEDWWYIDAAIARAAGLDELAERTAAFMVAQPWKPNSNGKLQAPAPNADLSGP